MKKFILLSFLASTILAGCAMNNDRRVQTAGDQNEKVNIIDTRPNADEGPRAVPGRTMSDQNPNLLNTNGGGNSRGKDIEHARTVINQSGNLRPGRIWIDGNGLWANVYTNGRLTETEERDARTKLHTQLTQALPRYQIEVRVMED
ncbi:hypothetical protein HHO41_07065 [Bacillus sp. DNRA2]|uniref:hypothetical protein n=1 Tax=Bacillus sp. DNRA2 TaxID=2723053 RepID=UPI00145F748B|nr:hypothetical protein [Bacillus sp. DNRA2]NMD70046.1 hypothetical protein [Bacillus sp. DNRA2]